MAELIDLVKLAPLPWSSLTREIYDARGIWLAEVREAKLAPLLTAAPMLAEELEELERWFRGINSVQLVTVDQAQRWAKVIGDLLKVATGGER